MKVLRLCCSILSGGFVLRNGFLSRSFVSVSKPLFLNRLLVNESELTVSDSGHSLCKLPPDDSRSIHIQKVLKLSSGDNLRVGIVDKGLVDKAALLSDPNEINNETIISLGLLSDLTTSDPPIVDLILVTPRPPRLAYLLPVIACLGVANIFLIGANKAEKAYFGSHLLSVPEEMTALLLDGLSQSSVDYHLPRCRVFKSFNHFINRAMHKHLKIEESYCVIAHPPSKETPSLSNSMTAVLSRLKDFDRGNPDSSLKNKRRVVVAIGPEGGWEEEEVVAFEQKGFSRVSLGRRILRTDIAVPVALGIANEWIDSNLK